MDPTEMNRPRLYGGSCFQLYMFTLVIEAEGYNSQGVGVWLW